ncbi:MAG: stage 0 sporulation family protein [Coriobacteriia bacterium]|nr:stage 0 sporulation family protein [Coriobacteriia bacterium]
MSPGIEDTEEVDAELQQMAAKKHTAKSKDDDTTVQVVGVRFRHSKTLWFDPSGHEPQVGQKLIVSTERGTEMGDCTLVNHEILHSELPAPLKPVLRIATDDDLACDKELQDEEHAAFPAFRELIEKNEIDMKPADIEILFGREKMIFYFSAEERIDFRQLVRDLAAHFHCRIEMRQIGVRDEARMAGGLGHCGEELCCSRMGGEFEPVSIRMAKEQGLPLNPSKISGVCGRLMCCLRYEVEAYKDFNRRAPKKGARIDTPRGCGKVVELDALRETVKLQFKGDEPDKQGDSMVVPLTRMCCRDRKGGRGDKGSNHGCGGRPCAIEPTEFERLEEESKQARSASLSTDGLNYMGLRSSDGAAVDNGKQAADDHRDRSSKGRKSRRSRNRDAGHGKNSSRSDASKENKKDAKSENSAGKQQGSGHKRSNRRNKGRRRKSGGKDKHGQSSSSNTRQGGSSQSGKGKQQANTTQKVETRVPRRRRRPAGE